MVNKPYEMYDLIPIEQQDDLIPTTLYNLKPIMNEGKNVESLSSYLIRLANAHRISVGILTTKILMEYLKRYKYNLTYSRNIYRGYAIHINGLGEFSEVNIEILQRLTGQRNLSDLTLIKFRDVFSKINFMKTNRTWCPYCLQQMKDTFHPPYEKLIWNINHYDVCVEHSTLLKSQCNQCGKIQNIIHVNSKIGYCQYCFSWLGEIKRSSDYNFEKSYEESVYKSKQVEELINYFFDKSKVKSENLISSFKVINYKLRENNILKDFSLTKLDITQESLLNYGYGKTIPQLGMSLKISRILDIRLVEILSGGVKKISLKNLDYQSKITKYNHSFHYEKVKQYLENTIESQNEYISMVSLEEMLNVSRKTLCFRFPELINMIRKNNDKINQNIKKKNYYRYNHKNDHDRVLSYLKKELISDESKTIEQMTFQLRVSPAILEKHFPNLKKEIKSKNKKLRKESKKYRGRGPHVPSKYKEMDINKIQEKLKAISELIVEEPKYINQIEKELGISQGRLRIKFPDMINLINAKNKEVKVRKRKKHINKCNQELISTITYLVSIDIYPGVETLQKYLSFKINNPVFLAVWRETLQGLGINRKTFGN